MLYVLAGTTDLQWEIWDGGHEHGAFEDQGEGFGEDAHGDGLRGGAVDGAIVAGIIRAGEQEGDEVVAVHPAHPLRARPQLGADKEVEERQHLAQHPALLGQDQPRPNAHHPRTLGTIIIVIIPSR